MLVSQTVDPRSSWIVATGVGPGRSNLVSQQAMAAGQGEGPASDDAVLTRSATSIYSPCVLRPLSAAALRVGSPTTSRRTCGISGEEKTYGEELHALSFFLVIRRKQVQSNLMV